MCVCVGGGKCCFGVGVVVVDYDDVVGCWVMYGIDLFGLKVDVVG